MQALKISGSRGSCELVEVLAVGKSIIGACSDMEKVGNAEVVVGYVEEKNSQLIILACFTLIDDEDDTRDTSDICGS